MKDQISALLDGELDPAEAGRLIGRLKTEPQLRRTWDDYHRVGDALRGHIGRDFGAAVAARLAAEPTVLGRRAGAPAMQQAWRWGLSAAAGLAAVALVAWMALPGRAPSPQVAQVPPSAAKPFQGSVQPTPLTDGPQVASAPRAVTGQAPERDAAAAKERAHAEALVALGMRNYLLAHQRFSPSSAMQGVAPYARTVASEGGER